MVSPGDCDTGIGWESVPIAIAGWPSVRSRFGR